MKKRYMSRLVIVLFCMFTIAMPASAAVDTSNDVAPSGPIIIDGYYDDWTSLDQDDAFTWYSNNTACSHVGGIYMDEEKVYVHVKVHEYYITQIPVVFFEFKINGEKKFNFSAFYKTPDNKQDWSGNTYDLPLGTTTLGLFNLDWPVYYMGDIKVSIYSKDKIKDDKGNVMKVPPDELEFSVDLDTISKITGIPKESIKTISLKNQNLGDDSITTSGTPTGAYFGVGISIAVAAGVLLYRRRKQVVK